jgi:hypothetical protein
MRVFFGLYAESTLMWRQNGDKDLSTNIDILLAHGEKKIGAQQDSDSSTALIHEMN